MPSSKEIKNRIKSVKSTKKITKAMELVAASKMKKAVSSTLASRLYAEYSWDILNAISENRAEINHPLFQEKDDVKNILLVLITSNRGLCGSYNAQVMKKALSVLKVTGDDTKIDVITIGKKGDAMMRRLGQNVIASFFEFPNNITLRDIVPVSKIVVDEFKKGTYDKVMVLYTDFESALSQKPNIKQVLPVSKTSLEELMSLLSNEKQPEQIPKAPAEYLFEGDKQEMIASLAEKLTRMQVYQMMLESNASEQSARMVAMKNASEAAGEMIEDLTLVFNKARQGNITREISEISAGMASVN